MGSGVDWWERGSCDGGVWFAVGRALGPCDDEEVVSLRDLFVEKKSGFLSRIGGIARDFIDLANDQILGNVDTG